MSTIIRKLDDFLETTGVVAKNSLSLSTIGKISDSLKLTSIDKRLKEGLLNIISTNKQDNISVIKEKLTNLVSDKNIVISDADIDVAVDNAVNKELQKYSAAEQGQIITQAGGSQDLKNLIKTDIKNNLDRIMKNDILDNAKVKIDLADSPNVMKQLNKKILSKIDELNERVKAAGGYENDPRVIDNDVEAQQVIDEIQKTAKSVEDAKRAGASPSVISKMWDDLSRKIGNLSFGKKVTLVLGILGTVVTAIVFIAMTMVCQDEREAFGTKIMKLERENDILKITIEKDMYDDLCERDEVNIIIYSKYIKNSDSIDFKTSSKIDLLSNNVFRIVPGDWSFFEKIPTGVATEVEGYGFVDLGEGKSVSDACFLCSVVKMAGGAANLVKDITDPFIGNPLAGIVNAIKKAGPWILGVFALVIIIFILKIFLSR